MRGVSHGKELYKYIWQRFNRRRPVSSPQDYDFHKYSGAPARMDALNRPSNQNGGLMIDNETSQNTPNEAQSRLFLRAILSAKGS